MTAEPEFYVEIELPRGDTTAWAVVGDPMEQPEANALYNHFLDLGIRVRLTTWALQVVRSAPEFPDRPATVETSVTQADTEMRKSGIRLPSVEDLVAKVKADMHAAEHEVGHLIGEIPHLRQNSENPAPEPAAEQRPDPVPEVPAVPFTPGMALLAAADKAADTSPDIPAVPATPGMALLAADRDPMAVDIDRRGRLVRDTPAVPPSGPDPAETSFDLPPVPAVPDANAAPPMPGEAGYVEHMLRVSRGQQGTRVTRQQG